MAVIDLRGDVLRNLALLGKSIGSIIGDIKGPDAADRRAFLGRVLGDPELLEEFGQIARTSPKALPAFLKDEDIETLKSVLPSLESLKEDIERPGVTPVKEGGTLTPVTAETIGEFARARDVGAKPVEIALGPKRAVAAEGISQEDVTAGVRREVTGLTPGGESQDTFNAKIFNSANKAFDALGLEEKPLAALRAKLPATFFDADNQELFRQRRILAQMQIDAANIDRVRERVDASERAIAARWVATTNVGVPETWQLFLFDIEANRKAKALDSGQIPVEGEADIRLMEVASAFARGDQVDKLVQEAAIDEQIRAILTRIGAVDRDGKFANTRSVRQSLTEMLNRKYVEISLLTDDRVPIRIGEIPEAFFGKGNKALVIRDERGEEIEPSPQRLEELRIQESQDIAEVERQNIEFGREEAGLLNFETVDVSKLPAITRDNLVIIMNADTEEERRRLFEQLQEFDPEGAQLILDARRNR